MSSDAEIMPRDSLIIASDIWRLTPDEKHEFKDAIMEFIKSKAYSSPEICKSKELWHQLQSIMYKYIPQINEKWEKIVVEYYTSDIDIEEAFSKINS
jgi:uncharacterized protein YaaR (DUF327 family)